MSALIDCKHRVQEYLRRIAAAKAEEGKADDLDDRIGIRHRIELETQWLGRYVYENAHVLGLWDT